MSVFMKRGARLFTIMGVLIIVLTFWSFLQFPFDKVEPAQNWFYLLIFILGIFFGVTEIAVAWLLGKHMN